MVAELLRRASDATRLQSPFTCLASFNRPSIYQYDGGMSSTATCL